MSRKTNLSYLFSLTLLLLAGCDKDSSPVPAPDTGAEPVEIRLQARMTQVSVSVTRAAGDSTAFITSLSDIDGGIGLYGLRDTLSAEDGSSATNGAMEGDNAYICNWKLTASPAEDTGTFALTGEGKIYFPAGRETAYLYAYAPYTETGITVDDEGNASVPVAGGWCEAEAPNNDPLWAKTVSTIKRATADETAATPNGTATFEFTHRMAQLAIHIYHTKTDAAAYLLQAVEVTFFADQHGKLNLRNGSIVSNDMLDGTTQSAGYTYTHLFAQEQAFRKGTGSSDNGNATDNGYTTLHSALPSSRAEGGVKQIRIKVTETAGNEGAWYIAYSYDGTATPIPLQQGKKTTVNIAFNPNTEASATIDNSWETLFDNEDEPFNATRQEPDKE